ncbi:MAG: leucyl/phenylalanyl-tRNA--protein transferase [Elusimicrobia bacterium]|nr:leucyl/phenylalanyl-tRNA--protein transferase [Elusimicrobiota bacterium]
MPRFPDPAALPDGESLCAVGGDLEPETLLEAYAAGIFPWPRERPPLLWHSPDPRGVLDFGDLRVPRSLRQEIKKSGFTFTADRAFARVIKACAAARGPGRHGTWITPAMVRAYVRWHELGHAHSVECWSGGTLVGGLYGVYVGGVFSGESMFHEASGASKACIAETVRRLAAQGLTWMDIQMVTPVTGLMGGKEIPRRGYLARLKAARVSGLPERLDFAA